VLLEARGLIKRYGKLTAVDGVSVGVAQGSCTGLLGPNGAGKSTTVAMLTGLIVPDGGEVLIDGAPLAGDADPKKQRLGLVPQELALYEELSAVQNLAIFGSLYHLSPQLLEARVREALSLVGLLERGADKVKTFSGGMKRRLNLAAALLHDPEVLILDEPTVGVDPQSRSAIFDNLETLRGRGKGILYTTHYMEEAERLCQRIVIVDHGKVVADDSLAGLARKMPASRKLSLTFSEAPSAAALEAIRALPGVDALELTGPDLSLTLADLATAPELLGRLASLAPPLAHFATERPSLEGIFLALTGRSLRDAGGPT
jgi:ABC-2 type transport system ATP-binding protein